MFNYKDFEYQIIKDLDPFNSEMTFFDQGLTYLSSRAKRPTPPLPPIPCIYAPTPWKEIFVVFMRVRQFIVLVYIICVYLCVNTLLSEISPTIIRDQPLLSEFSHKRQTWVWSTKQWKKQKGALNKFSLNKIQYI